MTPGGFKLPPCQMYPTLGEVSVDRIGIRLKRGACPGECIVDPALGEQQSRIESQGVGVVRIHREQVREHFVRLGGPAGCMGNARDPDFHHRRVCGHVTEGLQSFRCPSVRHEQIGEFQPRAGVIQLFRDAPQIRLGPAPEIRFDIKRCNRTVRLEVRRVERDGLYEFAFGVVEPAGGPVKVRERQSGADGARTESDSFLEGLLRLVVIAAGEPQGAKIHVSAKALGVAVHCTLCDSDALSRSCKPANALPRRTNPRHVKDPSEGWRGRDLWPDRTGAPATGCCQLQPGRRGPRQQVPGPQIFWICAGVVVGRYERARQLQPGHSEVRIALQCSPKLDDGLGELLFSK